MKKLRALVITVPLLLLMTENVHALPTSGMPRGQYESHPPEEGPAPLPANKTGAAQTLSKGKAAGGKKSNNVARKRRHGRGRHARQSARRKSRRYSDAARARDRLKNIKKEYKRRTAENLVVTSFGRTPSRQARAVRGLITRHGVKYVRDLYRNSPAINEVLTAYLNNRRRSQKAQREMTRVIEDQVARGVYVSKHLRGLAADIRRRGKGAARLSALRAAARKAGATVLVEPECYHLNLV